MNMHIQTTLIFISRRASTKAKQSYEYQRGAKHQVSGQKLKLHLDLITLYGLRWCIQGQLSCTTTPQ